MTSLLNSFFLTSLKWRSLVLGQITSCYVIYIHTNNLFFASEWYYKSGHVSLEKGKGGREEEKVAIFKYLKDCHMKLFYMYLSLFPHEFDSLYLVTIFWKLFRKVVTIWYSKNLLKTILKILWLNKSTWIECWAWCKSRSQVTLNFYLLKYPQLYNKNNNSTYFTGLLWGSKEVITVKHLAHRLAHSKYYINVSYSYYCDCGK